MIKVNDKGIIGKKQQIFRDTHKGKGGRNREPSDGGKGKASKHCS